MSSDEATDAGGRGKRQVKSRIMMVGGQAVLRLNNYDLEQGEPSVFDRELDDAAPADQAQLVPRAPRSAHALPKPRAPPKEKRPLQASDVERRRAALNEVIRADAAVSSARRAHFMHEHAELFSEFGARIPATAPAGSASDARAIEAAVARAATLRPPRELTAELRDYQLQGLRWLATAHARGHSAILGDEMGLGKTLQTIAFLAHLKFDLGLAGASLVIAPLSCISSWVVECRRFCPALRVVKLHSSDGEERERLKREVLGELERYDVVITTYEMAKAPHMHSLLAQRTWWRYVVVDEGHVLKNEGSLISKAVRGFHCQHALLLTGTPLQNSMHELWALLNYLFPDIFPDSAAFDCAFKLHGGRRADEVDKGKLLRAHALLQPLMLRRVKGDVEKRLPEKLETTIECPLSDMQLFWYKRLLLRDHSLLGALEAEAAEAASASGTDWKKLQNLLMQLRKVCNHPYLIDGAENVVHASTGSREYTTALVEASGKLAVLDRLLRALHAGGHRVVLFSQYCMMLDLLEEYCFAAGWEYRRLDGSTNRVQRTVNINSFNAPGSKIFLFLMSTRAGGLGINCQTADTCVLFDSDWNPQADLQAAARVHRIGQTKTVHIYRLVSSGTVEARILQHAEKKLYLDRMVNQDSAAAARAADGAGGEGGAPSEGELLAALKFGTQVCFRSEHARPPTDEEIGAIIDRTRTADASVGALRGGQAHAAAEFDASALPQVSVRELRGVTYGKTDGKTFRECRSVEEIGEQWREHVASQRARTSTTVTEFVKGVGLVAVKRANNYTMSEGMRLERKLEHRAPDGGGRQIAGRDYDHESFCLSCWDGGELVCCDHCPCAYHPACLGLDDPSAISSFSWSCPHHSCATCSRKATSAGGLLFRCAVCPGAWCEDHLLEGALVTGTCERLEALGFRHPKQGCFVLCSDECKAWALEQGLIDAESAEAFISAAAIVGATGVDTTNAEARAKEAAHRRKQWVTDGDERSAWERLDPDVSRALKVAAAASPLSLEQASRAWAERASELPDHMALLLHDVCYETELLGAADALNSKQAMAAEAAKARAALGRWCGPDVPAARGSASGKRGAPSKQLQQLADFYLRSVRSLELVRTYILQALCRSLGMAKVSFSASKHASQSGPGRFSVSEPPVLGAGRKTLAPLLALFLARPLPELLYLGPGSSSGAFEPLCVSAAFPSKQLAVVDGQVRDKSMLPPPPPARPPQPTPAAMTAQPPPGPRPTPEPRESSAVRPISLLKIEAILPEALASQHGKLVLTFGAQADGSGPESVTVGMVKERLFERLRIPPASQRLLWQRYELRDDTVTFGALCPSQVQFRLHFSQALTVPSVPAPPLGAPVSALPPAVALQPTACSTSDGLGASTQLPPPPPLDPVAPPAKPAPSPAGRTAEPVPSTSAAPSSRAASTSAGSAKRAAPPEGKSPPSTEEALTRKSPRLSSAASPGSAERAARKSPRCSDAAGHGASTAQHMSGAVQSGAPTHRQLPAEVAKLVEGSAGRPSPVAMRPLGA